MATPDIYLPPATPDPFKMMNSPRLNPSNKETQESLKRSFAKYLASEHPTSQACGKLFNPSSHICYEPPTKVHTMEDIGFSSSSGVSPVAVSEPFRLFSEEAVNLMRSEILDPEVQAKYSYTSDIAPRQIRGYCPKYGKFIYEAWKHPETLSLISKIAGIDVVPEMDYEIGHVNMSVPGEVKESDPLAHITEDEEEETAIVGWHRDSYPFVCVLMMSDTTGMIGGETALRTGTGEIMKVRGPMKGCAVVLQGRYIDHQALRAFGGQERMTMVTSFRPRSPFIRDDTVLNTVRPISELSDLYGQTAEYQLENMEARVRDMIKSVREGMKANATDVGRLKAFLNFEMKALEKLDREIVEESLVVKGHLGDAGVDGAKRIKRDS